MDKLSRSWRLCLEEKMICTFNSVRYTDSLIHLNYSESKTMNKLTNTILTTIDNLTLSSNALTKVADNLLDRIVPQEAVSAAWCIRLYCNHCAWGKKACIYKCFKPWPVIRTRVVSC